MHLVEKIFFDKSIRYIECGNSRLEANPAILAGRLIKKIETEIS